MLNNNIVFYIKIGKYAKFYAKKTRSKHWADVVLPDTIVEHRLEHTLMPRTSKQIFFEFPQSQTYRVSGDPVQMTKLLHKLWSLGMKFKLKVEHVQDRGNKTSMAVG